MHIETLVIPTQDGYQLAATEFKPTSDNGTGIIINGATGVLRKYYQAFAEHLCKAGFTVLTYDFRGIGDSKNKADHSPEPSMLHWGQRDMDAVFNLFAKRHPHLTIKGVGHSIGGQLLGVMPDNNRYASFLNIASQHIYWKNWHWKDRPMATLFFFVILPFFYTFSSGLPKWVLGAEFLPKQVAKDWSRFGRKRAWIADEQGRPLREGFHGFTGRMKLLGMSDDKRFAPPWAVQRLAQTYKNAEKDVKIINPKEYGMKAIDHFGFFQRKMNKSAWDDCVQWLAQN